MSLAARDVACSDGEQNSAAVGQGVRSARQLLGPGEANGLAAQMRRALIVFITKLVSIVSTHLSLAIFSLMKRS